MGEHCPEFQRRVKGSTILGMRFPAWPARACCGLNDLFHCRRSDCCGTGQPHNVCVARGAVRQRTANTATRTGKEPQEPAIVDLPRHCLFRQRRQKGSARRVSPRAGDFAGLSARAGRGSADRVRRRRQRRGCTCCNMSCICVRTIPTSHAMLAVLAYRRGDCASAGSSLRAKWFADGVSTGSVAGVSAIAWCG